MTPVFLYAHRGASAEAPENTLAAFRRALECGADGIELDIHLSADGVPVVLHDDRLERTSDGSGAVADRTVAELAELDAGSWFSPEFAGEPLPTLEETLGLLAGRLRLNLEVKDSQAGMAVLDLLRGFPGADTVISSFDHALLAKLRRAAPDQPLAVLLEDSRWRQALARAEALRACALHPHDALIGRPLLAACVRLQLPVIPWTVDDPVRARTLVRMGVAGFFTNDPGRLRRYFAGGAA